jgi:hypothetical protein
MPPGPCLAREGVGPAAHHLDVLLRHRLRPQPGGFEGRVAVSICPGHLTTLITNDPPP